MKRVLMLVTITSLLAGSSFAQNDIQLRGLVDMAAQSKHELDWLNSLNTGDGTFDPLRARLFVDGQRDNTSIFLQFLFSNESFMRVRLFGAYLVHDVFDDSKLMLEGGLIPSHNGTWASNTYSNKNPLVATPLSYYWKSSLPYRQMPNDLDDLLAHRGQGQNGIAYADSNGVRGEQFTSTMPLLYDNCWNYGLYAMGTLARFDYAVGATVGTPSAPNAEPDINDNVTANARFGYAVTPGLKLWATGSYGAYLSRDVGVYLPAGKSSNDYFQRLFGLSADYKWNHLWLTGEWFYNKYDTPLRADGLSNTGAYLMASYTVFPQWDVSVRYDELRFAEVNNSVGDRMTWDQNIHRLEGGVMYRVTRDLRVKAVVQDTDTGGGFSDGNTVPALAISFAF